MTDTPPVATYSLLRELGYKHAVDPRTLRRILDGREVRGLAAIRARRALEEVGLLPKPAAPSDTKGGQP